MPGLCILFAVVSNAFAEDTPTSLSFTETNGFVYAVHRTTKLIGPHYVIATCWRESNTTDIHLEYTIFQNLATCLKSSEECKVKWHLKDVGVTDDNRKEFTYQVKEQVVWLKSEDIARMWETLLPKK